MVSFGKRAPRDWRRAKANFRWMIFLRAMPSDCVASLEVPLPPGREPLAHARHLLAAARAIIARHEQVTS